LVGVGQRCCNGLAIEQACNFACTLIRQMPNREWAYDREPHIGKLDQGLDEADKKGWTVVDMKDDWQRVFRFKSGE
jgi:hypothetical protein